MQSLIARAKYTPISEVLKDAPKKDKAALLELAEALPQRRDVLQVLAVAEVPVEILELLEAAGLDSRP